MVDRTLATIRGAAIVVGVLLAVPSEAVAILPVLAARAAVANAAVTAVTARAAVAHAAAASVHAGGAFLHTLPVPAGYAVAGSGVVRALHLGGVSFLLAGAAGVESGFVMTGAAVGWVGKGVALFPFPGIPLPIRVGAAVVGQSSVGGGVSGRRWTAKWSG